MKFKKFPCQCCWTLELAELLSESVYKQLPSETTPPILNKVKCSQLRLADGTSLRTLGCARVQIYYVDSTPVECDVTVAAVSDPGILGLDFLR